MQKYFGILVASLGVWWTYSCWYDPVEGKYFRPICVAITILGVCLIVGGMTGEICKRIERAIERKQQEENK